jgi:lipopolysaccharide biosynthesis protein
MILYLLLFSLLVLLFFTYAYKTQESFSSKKILVLYVFHDKNERVDQFLTQNIFYDENIDFLIISNNTHTNFSLPDYPNVSFIKRPNVGYDFGGWSEGILTNNRYKNYDYFLFLNSSIKGPYLETTNKKEYVYKFIRPLNNDTRLFGVTINTCKGNENCPHVQSYAFSMNQETLQHLINENIFSNTHYPKSYLDAIHSKEIPMSRAIIDKGWNIGCMNKIYNNIDFRLPITDKNALSYEDIMYKQYQNKLWNNNELVFVKGNRDVE